MKRPTAILTPERTIDVNPRVLVHVITIRTSRPEIVIHIMTLTTVIASVVTSVITRVISRVSYFLCNSPSPSFTRIAVSGASSYSSIILLLAVWVFISRVITIIVVVVVVVIENDVVIVEGFTGRVRED